MISLEVMAYLQIKELSAAEMPAAQRVTDNQHDKIIDGRLFGDESCDSFPKGGKGKGEVRSYRIE